MAKVAIIDSSSDVTVAIVEFNEILNCSRSAVVVASFNSRSVLVRVRVVTEWFAEASSVPSCVNALFEADSSAAWEQATAARRLVTASNSSSRSASVAFSMRMST